MSPRPPILTCAQVRDLDRRASEEWGVPGIVLMENAGRGVVEALLEIDPRLLASVADPAPRVLILCGKGNNGGDGLVVARHLEIHGVPTAAILFASPDELQGDAAVNRRILTHCRTPLVDLSQIPVAELAGRLDALAGRCLWLVDALLGTGAKGSPREPYASAIQWMNSQSARRLAIDLPSGLDGDTGQAYAPTVRADATVTLAALKPGLVVPESRPWVGELRWTSIGLPFD